MIRSSAGAVQYANLTAAQYMQRFDWVTAFNVLDILPSEERRRNFLENVFILFILKLMYDLLCQFCFNVC